MKKFILAMLAVGAAFGANAQKGTILLYGNAGLNTNNQSINTTPTSTDVKNLTWNISPGIGYQFHNNLTIGIQGGYGMSTTDYGAGFKERYMEYQAGVFFRHTHYFNNIFAAWHQIDLSYIGGGNRYEFPAPGVDVDSMTFNGFQATLTPAVAVMVAKGVALNFSVGGLGFRTTTTDLGGNLELKNSQFVVTMGQQFNFGVTKNINCKRKVRGGGNTEPGMERRRLNTQDDEEEETPRRRQQSNDDDDE